ncbi:hypothetical protein [Kitasatospora sp. DSM 101779]|uniref:hypothetical protein n=1 Tax=Kitasatospora sp. DSM 101779 TaxID=2853165 RepID=UPI0037EC82E1|nr:hypothetical protein [Kitasatospora sp. DSM 101779]
MNASATVNGDFDLIATGDNGRLYEALRHANGTWVGWTDLTAKIAGSPGTITEVAAATTTRGDLQLVAVSGGKLWHLRATAAGTWSGGGDLFANSSNPGTATHVAAAGVAGALQVLVTTNSLYHAIRAASGSWSAFGDAGSAVGGVAGPIVSLAMGRSRFRA